MNIPNLLITLRVKGRQLLSGGCVNRLLEIRAQAGPSTARFLGDAVGGIDALGAVGGFDLRVEV